MKLYNSTQNKLVSQHVELASSLFERTKGLLGCDSLPLSHTMWIHRCPSVHTFFMKFPIDVVFVNKKMRVTSVLEHMVPWRVSPFFQFQNDSCFEFASQNISHKIKPGDHLDVRT